ncbi:MAG: PASTA domain-containing protein, partial [Chloroflexota bacterium]
PAPTVRRGAAGRAYSKGAVAPAPMRTPSAPGAPPRHAPAPQRTKKRSRLTLVLAGSVLVFFALMAVGAALAAEVFGPGLIPPRATATTTPSPTPAPTATPTPVPTVPVPNVVGDPRARAESRLGEVDLTTEITEEFSKEVPHVPAGTVMAQDPPPDTPLEQGQPVKLTVSKGPLMVAVPDVITKTNNVAVDELRKAEFVPEVREEHHRQVERGLVFRQVPAADAPAPIGSTVTITVSKGRDEVTVPAVRGLPEDEARKLLTDAGLQVVVDHGAYTGVQPGQVFASNPTDGARVDRGETIRLQVRRDPTPTATPVPPTPTNIPVPARPSPTPSPRPAAGPAATPAGTPPPGATAARGT